MWTHNQLCYLYIFFQNIFLSSLQFLAQFGIFYADWNLHLTEVAHSTNFNSEFDNIGEVKVEKKFANAGGLGQGEYKNVKNWNSDIYSGLYIKSEEMRPKLQDLRLVFLLLIFLIKSVQPSWW